MSFPEVPITPEKLSADDLIEKFTQIRNFLSGIYSQISLSDENVPADSSDILEHGIALNLYQETNKFMSNLRLDLILNPDSREQLVPQTVLICDLLAQIKRYASSLREEASYHHDLRVVGTELSKLESLATELATLINHFQVESLFDIGRYPLDEYTELDLAFFIKNIIEGLSLWIGRYEESQILATDMLTTPDTIAKSLEAVVTSLERLFVLIEPYTTSKDKDALVPLLNAILLIQPQLSGVDLARLVSDSLELVGKISTTISALAPSIPGSYDASPVKSICQRITNLLQILNTYVRYAGELRTDSTQTTRNKVNNFYRSQLQALAFFFNSNKEDVFPLLDESAKKTMYQDDQFVAVCNNALRLMFLLKDYSQADFDGFQGLKGHQEFAKNISVIITDFDDMITEAEMLEVNALVLSKMVLIRNIAVELGLITGSVRAND